MSEHHELTVKIYYGKYTRYHIDMAVREWLEKKAEELAELHPFLSLEAIGKILGLEEKECCQYGNCHLCREKKAWSKVKVGGAPVEKKEWPCKCLAAFDKELREKFNHYIPMDEIKECPSCHKTRPHKSLAEALHKSFNDHNNYSRSNASGCCDPGSMCTMENLANAAIDWVLEQFNEPELASMLEDEIRRDRDHAWNKHSKRIKTWLEAKLKGAGA